MIEYYFKKKTEDKIEKIKSFKSGCWINASNPSDEEIDKLVSEFGLDKTQIDDALDIFENPRFEVEGKRVYIFLTAPTKKIPHEYSSSFLAVYSKDYLITISKYPLEIFENMLNSRTKSKDFSSSINLIKILHLISRMYEQSVMQSIKDVRKNKAGINKLREKDIAKLIDMEDQLNEYISSFGAIMQTYTRIIRDRNLRFFKKEEELIKDLIIDLEETLTICKQTLKTISNMRSYYSTKLSNELNKTVTVLTVVTILLAIPTLISSIYGMNIPLPFQTSQNILWVLSVCSVGIISLLFLILKKTKIL